MTRRTLLLAAALGTAALTIPARAAPRRPVSWPRDRGPAAPRRLRLRHAGTGARFDGPYHTGTGPDPAALRDLSVVLADGGATPARPFDARALDILWQVAANTGLATGEIAILSGYRTPAINAAARGAGDSQHLRAAALDVLTPSGRLATFGEAALSLGAGGVGLYPQRGFVHLDSGPVRRWGETATVPAGGGPGGRRQRPAEDPIGRVAEAWAAARPR